MTSESCIFQPTGFGVCVSLTAQQMGVSSKTEERRWRPRSLDVVDHLPRTSGGLHPITPSISRSELWPASYMTPSISTWLGFTASEPLISQSSHRRSECVVGNADTEVKNCPQSTRSRCAAQNALDREIFMQRRGEQTEPSRLRLFLLRLLPSKFVYSSRIQIGITAGSFAITYSTTSKKSARNGDASAASLSSGFPSAA